MKLQEIGEHFSVQTESFTKSPKEFYRESELTIISVDKIPRHCRYHQDMYMFEQDM